MHFVCSKCPDVHICKVALTASSAVLNIVVHVDSHTYLKRSNSSRRASNDHISQVVMRDSLGFVQNHLHARTDSGEL